MIVCVCNNVNDKAIESIVDQKGVKSLEELKAQMRVCNQCCCCSEAIQDIIYCSEWRLDSSIS